jgi:nucleoside-diphosphate-sugar epimerase
VPSIARAEKELGLVPRIDWREAVDRTLAWHRAARAEGEA